MSDESLTGAIVTCPCCGYSAPIGRFMDREPRGCPDCEATLAEIREAATEVLEA